MASEQRIRREICRLAQCQKVQTITATLFDGDGLGQVTRTVHVASTEDGNVVREQLHWNNRQDTLEAIDSVWHFDKLGSILLCLQVTSFADDDRTALAGSHLLQGVDAFLANRKIGFVSNGKRNGFAKTLTT